MINTKKTYNCIFDGACEPSNPGGDMGMGGAIFDENKKCLDNFSVKQKARPANTNNIAEYLAFTGILAYFLKHNITNSIINIYGDSMMVINQMNGDWQIKKGAYKKYADGAKIVIDALKAGGNEVKCIWICREKNIVADKLSRAALKNRR